MSLCWNPIHASHEANDSPSNLVCNKIGPKIWLPALCFGFGVLTMCTAFVTQYESLVAIRVLLGAFEAGIQPGILTAYARFYRRHELVTRQGIKASMAALAGSFGGLLAAGLSHIPPSGPLHSWRWIFLIEGILTLAVAVVAYFALADDPSNAPFLTTEEQDIGSQRIALEILTHKRGRAGADSFKKALLNINTQVIAVCVLCTLVSMTSLSIFMPTLLKSLMNYGRTEAQLMSVPPYAIAATILVAAAITSDKHKRRGIVLASILPTTVVGFSLVIFVQSTAAKYVGIVLACIGAFTGSSILIAWIVDNTAGPTVRAIAVAYVAAVGNIGAIVATWAYLPDDAPTYRTGNCINLGVAALVSVLVPVLSLYLHWENGERAAGKRDYRFQQVENIENLGHANPRYRMTL